MPCAKCLTQLFSIVQRPVEQSPSPGATTVVVWSVPLQTFPVHTMMSRLGGDPIDKLGFHEWIGVVHCDRGNVQSHL